jgi:Family of unknown function (DUF6283)
MTAAWCANHGQHAPRGLPHVRRPCDECPWRRDVPPGKFPASRYTALAETTGEPGGEAALLAPMFACHKTPDSGERACAGWLAVAGYGHLGVRLAVLRGQLKPDALSPRPGWPELFASYAEMAETQGRRDD